MNIAIVTESIPAVASDSIVSHLAELIDRHHVLVDGTRGITHIILYLFDGDTSDSFGEELLSVIEAIDEIGQPKDYTIVPTRIGYSNRLRMAGEFRFSHNTTQEEFDSFISNIPNLPEEEQGKNRKKRNGKIDEKSTIYSVHRNQSNPDIVTMSG